MSEKKFYNPKIVNFRIEKSKKKKLDMLLLIRDKNFTECMNELIDSYLIDGQQELDKFKGGDIDENI